MNKLIIALMAIYFIGDPGLQYLTEGLYRRCRHRAGFHALDRFTA